MISKQIEPPLLTITLARTFLNAGLQFVYPFLPALARGTGLTTNDLVQIIAWRAVVSFLSPFFAPLASRFGSRTVMSGSLLIFALASLFPPLLPNFFTVGFFCFIVLFAKIVHDPVMQGYLGDVVPYERRGRAIMMTELSWSSATLFMVPLIGWLMERYSWESAFYLFSISGFLFAFLVYWRMPNHYPVQVDQLDRAQLVRVWSKNPILWFAAVSTILLTIAGDQFYIVYGTWMEDSFQLSLSSLGIATAVIGGGQLIGELIVGFASDLWGKKKTMVAAGFLTATAYLLFLFSSQILFSSLLSLFLLFLAMEITIVSLIILFTELVPDARVAVMAVMIAVFSLGRGIGAWTGVWLFGVGGLNLVVLFSAFFMFVSISIIHFFVTEPQTVPTP